MGRVIEYKPGVKSYNIIYNIMTRLGIPAGSIVLDLTYGRGRFYRVVKPRLKPYLIGVDIIKHEWEVEPDRFYNANMLQFVEDVLAGWLELQRPNIVVVDPPWSHEKRGYMARGLGISGMPYHMRGVKSSTLINTAKKLARYYNVPLLYRYKEKLQGRHILSVIHNITVFRNKGRVFYGVLEP